MIPGLKAQKAVRACTKGFELGTRKNIRRQQQKLLPLVCVLRKKVNVERFFHGETIVYR